MVGIQSNPYERLLFYTINEPRALAAVLQTRIVCMVATLSWVVLLTFPLTVQAQVAKPGQEEPIELNDPSILKTLETDRRPSDEPHFKNVYDAVAKANQLLLKGDAQSALNVYQRADELLPGTPEIAFGEGLAHFKLQQYDQARQAFEAVGMAKDDPLASDALYSLGTVDHAEALAGNDNPKLAIERLEQAMQNYHTVLSRDPDHQAAREANYRAANLWRQIKQQMQQQQQESGESDNSQEKDQEKDEQQKQQQKNQQKEDRKQENQKERSKEAQQQESDQDQQSQGEQDQQEQQEGEQQANDDQQDTQDESAAQQLKEAREEQATLEQARRQLRELMQALMDRQRKRERRPTPQRQPAPAQKNW